MPRINRMRVTNINYDDHKKQLPDLFLKLRGQDSILLLANGGGKTLLIQLALQTVLPNMKMNNRKILDLLKGKRFSGHVALEWILDGEGDKQQYLCTGFTFTKGYDDEGLLYMNYLFNYGEGAQLTIETLPLIKLPHLFPIEREEPISYWELKDYLKIYGHVQVFEKKRGLYQKQLETYHILPEEWKRIRDTNGTEGGVDKFFERCRTTSQLLENLLIPGVEGILFKNEAMKKEILRSFSKHRSMLLEIPIIKANIKDFQVIREQAEMVISQVKELHHLEESLGAAFKKMVEMVSTLKQELERIKEVQSSLGEEKRKLHLEKEELEWKKESYQVFLKDLQYRRTLKIRDEKEAHFKIGQEREALLKKKYLQLKGLYYFQLLEGVNQQIKSLKTQLKLLDEKEPELKEKLKGVKEECLFLLEKEEERRDEDERKVKENKRAVEERISQQKEELQRIRKVIPRDEKKKYGLKRWFEDYKTTKKGLATRKVPLTLLGIPQRACQEYATRLMELEEEKESLEERMQNLRDKREECEEENKKVITEKTHLERDLKDLERFLGDFLREKDKVEGELAAHSTLMYFTKEIFLEKEVILDKVWRELEKARESRVIKQGELWSTEERWGLIQRRNYYVPHGILITLKGQLEERGIYTVLGSEWLAAQGLEKGQKEEYVENNPLLPYCILIEENQKKAVLKVLRSLKELTQDFPLLFIIKKDLISQREKVDEMMLWVGQSMLYRPPSWDIFMCTEKFEDFKEGLANERDKRKKEFYQLKNREEETNRLREKVKTFYGNYSHQKLIDQENKGARIKGDLIEIEGTLGELEEEKKGLGETLKGISLREKDLDEKIREHRDLITQLDSFTKLHQLFPFKEGELEETQKNINSLKEKEIQLEWEKEKLTQEKYHLKGTLTALYQRQEAYRKDFSHLGLEGTKPRPGEGTYEEKKAQVLGLLDTLRDKSKDRSSLERLLQQQRKEGDLYVEMIGESGLTMEWLKAHLRSVTKQEYKEGEKSHHDGKEDLYRLSNTLLAADKDVDKAKALRDREAQGIQQQFHRSPYLEFSSSYREEYKGVLEELQELSTKGEKLIDKIREIENWEKKLLNALEFLEFFLKEGESSVMYYQKVKPLKEVPENPEEMVKLLNREKEGLEKGVEEQKKKVELKFYQYLNRLEKTDNGKVRQFRNNVETIMKDQRLFQYPYVLEQFSRIMEALDQQQDQYRQTLQESQKNMDILTDRCVRRAKTIYDNIIEIPRNSKILLYNREVSIIRIEWPVLPHEEGKKEIHRYLEKVLKDLQQWKEEGMDDDEMDQRMEDLIRSRNLIHVIAPIKDCQIRVYKPRAESMVGKNLLNYSPWDEVNRWSGGEEYSIYVAMFMIIISHIREQLEGRPNTWKVIMADNPFGRASSSHILEVVFQIARSNHIQFISFTAHKQEEILKRFPVVYSLRLRSAFGREVMQAEEMETGYYLEPSL